MVGALFSIVIDAHARLSLEADDMCRLTVGPYIVLFSWHQSGNLHEITN